MSNRPFVLLALIAIAFGITSANAQIPDNTTFTDCINKKLEDIEMIKGICGATEKKEAAASANAGVATPDPGQEDGNVQECINNSVARLRKTAQKECTEKARSQMMTNLQSAPPAGDEPVDPGATTASCVPTATRKCPDKTVPTPPKRPPGLGAKTPKATPEKSPAAKSPPSKTDRTNRAAADSSKKTTPQAPSAASGDAGNDVSLCESSYSSASRCCGNPASCAGELSYQDQRQLAEMNALMNQPPPTTSQGLTDYCQQMQGLGSGGRGVNSSLAGICNSKQMSCSYVCSDLAQKYQTLISNCNGCESSAIYQNTYAQLMSRSQSCSALASRVSQISNQAINSSASAGYGNLCNNVAGSNPQTMGGSQTPPANSPSANLGGGNDRFAQNCTDPTNPACRAVMNAQPTGTASFDAGEAPAKKSKGNFDIPGDAPLTEKNFFGAGVEPQAVKNGTVANNAGGGIPGGGGGAPASLGSSGKPAASPGAPGYTTDIMNGMQGEGGYSAPVQANGPGDEQPGRDSGRNRALASIGDDNGGVLGMDLRQFLPGGSRDPQRRMAGVGRRSEINGKEEDIWRLISSKMVEKCKLGILVDCR